MFCDLHMHSTASDGTNPPPELAILAQAAGLRAIALTDHDTTEGLPACAQACATAGVDFIPGIELSADPGPVKSVGSEPRNRKSEVPTGTLHLLGYFVRHDEPALDAIHKRLLGARQQRNPQIIANLQALGVNIEYEEVLDLARTLDTRVVGRPHIAQVLVKKGYVKSVQDAFSRYLGEGKAAYARKDLLSHQDAIGAIHRAGGLAVLAHPAQLRCPDADALEHAIARLKDAGLDGIETRHTDHTPAQVDQFEKLAARMGLLTSGGSDYHGTRKPTPLGSQHVPLSVAQRLRQEYERRRGAA